MEDKTGFLVMPDEPYIIMYARTLIIYMTFQHTIRRNTDMIYDKKCDGIIKTQLQ